MKKKIQSIINSQNNIFFYLISFLLIIYGVNNKIINNIFSGFSILKDTDIIYFKYILDNGSKFNFTLDQLIAKETFNSFNSLFLPFDILKNLNFNEIQILFLAFLVQLIIGTAGIFLLGKSLGLKKLELLLFVVYTDLSCFAGIGRYISGIGFTNKFLSSTFALAIGFIVISLFINGRKIKAIIYASLLVYIHPVHSILLIGLISSNQFFEYIKNNISYKNYFKQFIFLPFLIISPIVFNYFRTSKSIISLYSYDLWWEFLKFKTTTIFPLQDGLIIVSTIFIFSILGIYFLTKISSNLTNQDLKYSIIRAKWILYYVLFLWILQIVFSEIIPISFITKLALTRVTPYSIAITIASYVNFFYRNQLVDKTLNRYIFLIAPSFSFLKTLFVKPLFLKNIFARNIEINSPIINSNSTSIIEDNASAIIENNFINPEVTLNSFSIKKLLMVFGNHSGLFARYNEFLLFIIVLSLIIIYKEVFKKGSYNFPENSKNRKRFLRIIFFSLNILLLNISLLGIGLTIYGFFNGENIILSITRIFIFFIVIIQTFTFIDGKINWQLKFAKKLNRYFSYIIIFALLISLINPTLGLKNKLNNLSLSNSTDENKLYDFIKINTNEEDMFAVLPLYNSIKLDISPLRPIFINLNATQYAIYYPNLLNQIKTRLELIGIPLSNGLKTSKKDCNYHMQYIEPMCRRIRFQEYSKIYNNNWRDGIEKMKSLAPNLKYVVIPTKHLIDNDNLKQKFGKWSLIEI